MNQQEVLYASDEKIAAVLEAREEELRKKYELCRKLTEEYKEKITMSTGRVEFFKGNNNDSIIVKTGEEQFVELFTDEQNIQPVIQAFDMIVNIPGYINLDVADILHFPKNYSAHSINYIHFRGKLDELSGNFAGKSHPDAQGVFISIKNPQTIQIEGISELSNSVISNYKDDIEIIWGTTPDESLNEFDVSIIEFY